MVVGLLPDAAATEILLNNLAEAEFDLHTVSVVMRDARQRAAIAEEAGPLKGMAVDGLAEHLTQAGLSSQQAAAYAAAVQQGKVFVAIAVPESLAATVREMLNDHAAQLIQGVP
jgi:hypothetical protein